MSAVFLQDADALATRPADLVEILGHLKTRFPSITRVTSYSRARTIAAKKDGDLKAIKDAGLTRLHVGLERENGKANDQSRNGSERDPVFPHSQISCCPGWL